MAFADPELKRYRPLNNNEWFFVLFMGWDKNKDGILCGWFWILSENNAFREIEPMTSHNIDEYVVCLLLLIF